MTNNHQNKVVYELVHTSDLIEIHLSSGGILVASWRGYNSLSTSKTACEAILDCFVEHNCTHVVNDGRRSLGTWNSTLPWLEKDFMPRLIGAGLKKLANIYSINEAARYSMDQFVAMDLPCEINVFSNFNHATEWLIGVPFKEPETIKNNSLSLNNGNEMIDIRDIYFISKHGNKSLFYFNGEEIESYDSLTSIMNHLPMGDFMRVHQGNIVNIKKIKNLEYRSGGHYNAYFKDFGQVYVPVSKDKVQDLKKAMNLIK